MRPQQPRLLVFNDPHPMRIDGALAAEIGLEESVMLLQLEYLISISTAPEHEGKRWTYQSLQELHDNHFPWWSVTTISRIVKSLERKRLILVANFNKKGYDRTRWYALNPIGINMLRSIAIYQNDKSILQIEKSIVQSGDMQLAKLKNPTRQVETPIPETSTETSTEREEERTPRFAPDAFDLLMDNLPPPGNTQPVEQTNTDSPSLENIPVAPAGYSPLAVAVAELCGITIARASTTQKQGLREAVEALREQNATPEQVAHFARYWKAKPGKTRPPLPRFVVQDWGDAMYSYRPPRGPALTEETPEEAEARYARLAEHYAQFKTVHPSTYRVASSGD